MNRTPYLIDFDPEVSDKDLSNDRVLELKNGNKVHIKKQDPYGFWRVSMERGQIPDTLKGEYTSANEAEKAVRHYLMNDHRRTVEAVKQ